MQKFPIRFASWNHHRRMLHTLVASSLIAAIAIGCAHHSAAAPHDPAPASEKQPELKGMWLPIHEKHNHITAVGSYKLPEAVIVPTGLTPFPKAFVRPPESPQRNAMSMTVYFPAGEELAVMKWAQSFPVIIAASGDFRWVGKKFRQYIVGTHVSSQPPTEPPTQWSVGGAVQTSISTYDINWGAGRSDSSSAIRKNFPDLYGDDSPVKNESRLIFLGVNFRYQYPQSSPKQPSKQP